MPIDLDLDSSSANSRALNPPWLAMSGRMPNIRNYVYRRRYIPFSNGYIDRAVYE